MTRYARAISVGVFTTLAITLLCSLAALAQDTDQVPQAHDGLSAEFKAAGRRADLARRAELAERLVASKESPGREFPVKLRTRIIAGLSGESVEKLEERMATGNIRTMAFGDTDRDLVYTPLPAPCRIIDTRGWGGPLTHDDPWSFVVAGGSGTFEFQGGTPGGCGVPIGATAAVINFVAVNPAGAGNLRGTSYPNAFGSVGNVINYQAQNIANAMDFPICNPATASCDYDITLKANGASVQVVADVLGYSKAAEVAPQYLVISDAQGSTTSTTFVNVGSMFGDLTNGGAYTTGRLIARWQTDFGPPACSAGTNGIVEFVRTGGPALVLASLTAPCSFPGLLMYSNSFPLPVGDQTYELRIRAASGTVSWRVFQLELK